MKQVDEQHMLRYLRKISENTERIAKALEARNNPRKIVEDALKSGPENKDPALDAWEEELARAVETLTPVQKEALDSLCN